MACMHVEVIMAKVITLSPEWDVLANSPVSWVQNMPQNRSKKYGNSPIGMCLLDSILHCLMLYCQLSTFGVYAVALWKKPQLVLLAARFYKQQCGNDQTIWLSGR